MIDKIKRVKKVKTALLAIFLLVEFFYRQHLWNHTHHGVDNFQLQYIFFTLIVIVLILIPIRDQVANFMLFISVSLLIIYGTAYSQCNFVYLVLVPLIIVFELDIDETFKAIFAYFIILYMDRRAGNIEDFRYLPFGDTTFGIDGEFIDP